MTIDRIINTPFIMVAIICLWIPVTGWAKNWHALRYLNASDLASKIDQLKKNGLS